MKRRQNPERMKALLARRERLGWSWAELERRSGLAAWKLRWWHKRFARTGAAGKPAGTFLRVRLVESPGSDGPPIEVITPLGFRIVVSPGFASEHLDRLLKALERPC